MPEHGVVVDGAWKKFYKGELHDSLRDLVPAVARRLVGRGLARDEIGRGEFWAVRDLSFQVQSGKAFGIIGPNGAGKSTTLKLLSRILRPNRGSVRISGRVGALIEIAAGFHPDLTGRENVFLQGAILGLSSRDIRERFDAIIAFAELEAFVDTPVKRYSSGMNARLGFAVATSLQQDVLLIDEVLSVGDLGFQQKSALRMTELVKAGAAVVFVSHNLRAVIELCDSAILLRNGEVVASGTASSVVTAYLSSSRPRDSSTSSAPVVIEGVTVGDALGERTDFRPGDQCRLDITLAANRDVADLSVAVIVQDLAGHHVFNTSSVRMNHPALTMKQGNRCVCRYELDLHLARGQFMIGVQVQSYMAGSVYDQVMPVTTIFMNTPVDVRGTTFLYPHFSVI